MQSNKDKSKKEGKSDKKTTDSGKKIIPKVTAKKESGKTISKSGSTISTSTTRPQTGRTIAPKASGKDLSKSTTKAATKPPIKAPTKTPNKPQTKTPSKTTAVSNTETTTAIDPKKKFPKFMKLIEKKKLFSGLTVVIQKRFNHWKTLTLLQKQQITEKTQKTIVTKKKLNIKRVQGAKQTEKKESSKIKYRRYS